MQQPIDYQNKRHPLIREFIAKTILFLADISIIFTVLFISFIISDLLSGNEIVVIDVIKSCIAIYPAYIIVSCIFFYEGIYSHRFDFWHESRKILKSLLLSFLTIISFGVLINQSNNYPIEIIFYSFIIIALAIPLNKIFLKKRLFKAGLWKKGVKVLSKNSYLESEIFGNPYLGYIKSKRENAQFVFIDSHNKNPEDLKRLLERQIQTKKRVLFIPVFNNYQFSNSDIYDLTNTRTNLVVLENKLKSRYRMFINASYNIVLAIISIPLILPIVAFIAFLINQDSKGPIFFRQPRLGKDGKVFMVFKFRTMYTEDVQKRLLADYLAENPQEIENYEIYCKYENDPRVTKVGNFLRKTSLDELAQILNVLKGDMNFVGPRPYLLTEKEKMGKLNEDVILKVKPGITGLWQVSGRNELTFDERVELEKWYVQNWALWKDFVIIMKTIGVVINKVGAR